MKPLFFLVGSLLWLGFEPFVSAQVNSGSNGSDGAFNPTTNVTIDMTDHPDGIYQYTSVSIPGGVTVTFIPNALNTPVTWLVQGDCGIYGKIDISGKASTDLGGDGGPGGFRGGNGDISVSNGQGPGGGGGGLFGGNASYGTLGTSAGGMGSNGQLYGNSFLLPLIGGSGGGGATKILGFRGGTGGGGAMLIAASGEIRLNGSILAVGASGSQYEDFAGGCGSGGGVRLVATILSGNGKIDTSGGRQGTTSTRSGDGRVRLDIVDSQFLGTASGQVVQGFQPIIIPAAGLGAQLSVASVGGVAVPGTPGGAIVRPDVTIPSQQQGPINVVVNCTNIPLNTDITVTIHPVRGVDISGTAKNTAGTQASSTATISIANMPRGGGTIYASAVTGLVATSSATSAKNSSVQNIAQTGWTAHGEPFVSMQITSAAGGLQQVSYVTSSGTRYPITQNN